MNLTAALPMRAGTLKITYAQTRVDRERSFSRRGSNPFTMLSGGQATHWVYFDVWSNKSSGGVASEIYQKPFETALDLLPRTLVFGLLYK